MTKVRFLNDLHVTTKRQVEIVSLPTDSDTILSLAGDIYDRKHIMPWLHELSARFKHIIVVYGNHDYWNGSYELVQQQHHAYLEEHKLTNIHILHEDYVVLDDVLFFGGTMWTDCNRGDPRTTMAYNNMYDYTEIRTHNYGKRFTVADSMREHEKFKKKLREVLANKELIHYPVMVVSHHAPCHLSTSPRYANELIMNGYYTSDLTWAMFDHPRIKIWHHGHLHNRSDYVINQTRVICNPSGYSPNEQIVGFDPTLMIDLTEITGPKDDSLGG